MLRIVFGTLYAVLIATLLLSLIKCERPAQSENPREREENRERPDNPDDELVENIIGRTGDQGKLKITLVWDEECDVDLHVIEPDDTHIYFSNKRPGGDHGYLDFDDTQGGRQSMENVYWENPAPGRYKFYLHLYSQGSASSVPCTVVIFKNGEEVRRETCTLVSQDQRIDFDDIVVP